MAMKYKATEEGINEINITPFVDIVLVLLIIFMISTPAMIYQGIVLSLPTAVNSTDISHMTLKLSISKVGKLYIGSKQITMSGLKDALALIAREKPVADAVISADKEVPHGTVMELSDLLKTYGIRQIGFATTKIAGK